jgi:hypothetical protein
MCSEANIWADSRHITKHVWKIPHQLVVSVTKSYFYCSSEFENVKHNKCQKHGNMIIAKYEDPKEM